MAQSSMAITQSSMAHSGEIGSEGSGVGSLCHKERISGHSGTSISKILSKQLHCAQIYLACSLCQTHRPGVLMDFKFST